MKCPKCGSKNVYECSSETETIYHCDDCYHYFKNNEQPEPTTELTTEEMLMWLVDNIESKNMYIQFGCGAIEIKKPLKHMEMLCETTEIKYGNGEVFTKLAEAIKAAYDKAKEQL